MKTLLYSIESMIFVRGGAPGRAFVSGVRSIANRRLQRFSIDSDGDYVNSQAEGVIVSPVANRTDFRKLRSRVADFWFHGYMPKSGDIVFDVGAGIGDEAVVFAHQVGTQGRVFSFEANPVTARCLSKTARRSGLNNIEVIAAAVFDHPGKVSIANGKSLAQNSLFESDRDETVEVAALTLDDFFEQNGIQAVDLLKINIEGAEREALLGFRRNFHRVRHVVISCHDWIADLGHASSFRTLEFVQGFLDSNGFSVKRRLEATHPAARETLYGSRRD